ncbi:WbqC family protein [Paraburkholderia sp.]|uniref:WbqC family protein n=1 Tax=Paraburkholderia sp. TaxID=1926495 RepID=UPI00257FAF6B|nr:WbqC family protein [Paraburkholderia sp.]
MRLGIMQPYFFPYLGHFALIAAVDEWVVFDVTQYTPKTWMNRNRILHPKEGWQYVTVPLANSSVSIKTHEARVLNLADAKTSLLGKLSTFRRHAPFHAEVTRLVQSAFERTESDSLCALNVNALRAVCEYIELPFSSRVCSELELEFPDQMGAGDWAPLICNALGATEYVNPVGGRDLFDPVSFERIGVSLLFAGFDELKYEPSPFQYEPHLSVLDVLLWNAPDKVARALRSHTVLHHASA